MRYDGMEVKDRNGDDPEPGIYYGVEVEATNLRWPVRRLELRQEPGRTNMSNEPVVSGWLGESNNINRWAVGRFEVYCDSVGRRRCRAYRGD